MLKELGGMLLTQVGRWKGCSKESVKVSFSHPGFQSVLLAMRNCPTKRKLTTYGATMTLEQCFSVFFFPHGPDGFLSIFTTPCVVPGEIPIP